MASTNKRKEYLMTNAATTSNGSGKKPSHVAYQVREIGNGKNFWNRVGVAWSNKNGGLTIQLESVPLDGRIVCQPADNPTPTE